MDTEKLNTPASVVLSDEELEEKLRSLKKWALVKKIVIPVGGVGGLALTVFFATQEMWGATLASAVVAPALMFGLYRAARKLMSAPKSLTENALALPVIKEIFEAKDYQPLGHIESEIIHSAGLIYGWERISGSDYIEGCYKGVNILYSDLHLWHTETDTDSAGKETEKDVTDFKGQWMICDFGKELAATLRLTPRKGGTRLNRTHDVGKSSVETENGAFNKKFRIITEDGYTAFYLLSPRFMEQLAAADEAADSSTLFCFMEGKVHIALYSGCDSFKLKGVKLDSVDSVRGKFRRELKYLTDIVDELLLNDRLFRER